MDWIKKNYDRFALMVLALVLLVSSIYLIVTANGFSDRFAPVLTDPPHGKKVTTLETEALERAEASLANPAAWAPHKGSIFVSRKYVAKRGNGASPDALVDPFDANSPALHPPIPNEWFLQNGMADNILDADVLAQDPDKDGFTNLEEFKGKTDPQNPDNHPGYLTKLFLKRFVKVSFRLKFEAYDGDGSFQINTVDVKQPSLFVKINDMIAGTKFKVIKFEKKSQFNPRTQVETDVSVLTVENTESGTQVGLVVKTEVNVPDHYAQFAFVWDHSEFKVKKDGTFSLKPEPDTQYKLIDIRDSEAVIINLKTNDQIKVPRLE